MHFWFRYYLHIALVSASQSWIIATLNWMTNKVLMFESVQLLCTYDIAAFLGIRESLKAWDMSCHRIGSFCIIDDIIPVLVDD